MKHFIPAGVWALLLTPMLVVAQKKTDATINSTLSGKVIDGKNRLLLPGASVHIKGTTHEVVTDDDGKFNFVTGQRFPYILIVSYIGYQTSEITADKSPIEIPLKEGTSQLDEVVVTGYGTSRRSDFTGSLASVSKQS